MRRAEIVLSGDEANLVEQVLAPESGRELPRTNASVVREGDKTLLRIEAEDTSALRAALGYRDPEVAAGSQGERDRAHPGGTEEDQG
jgi:tRNA threonylcarbamoyladenosine modification (KEOPS) complex  Pcc1 subunit